MLSGTLNISMHATLSRLMCLSDLYTISCVMEEPERFARLNPNAELIVDLRRVGHVSLEILSGLLWLKNSLELCGGILHLSVVGNDVQELLQLTGMATIFEVADERSQSPKIPTTIHIFCSSKKTRLPARHHMASTYMDHELADCETRN